MHELDSPSSPPAATDHPDDEAGAAEVPPEPTPLLLRDGLPALTDTPAALHEAVQAIAAGRGPVAIDTERASGYRYGQRAYLIQLRREGAGTVLLDPVALPDLAALAAALGRDEWVLHAASQDLPCLADLGLRPVALFDTELAGRLLGLPRVGLGPMVEQVLGHSLRKAHGAADWSTRPLPAAWLEYAALDVEVLLELRALLAERLREAGKMEWAEQEFAAVRDADPAPPRPDPWRRTSGIHRVRSRRGLAVVQQLWLARDRVAREADIAPGRLLPDSSIVAAASELPRGGAQLRALTTFHGRGARQHHRVWVQALQAAWEIPEADLPVAAGRGEGPPPARAWASRDPVAAARLDRARGALRERAHSLDVPVENLLAPDVVRRLMWQPPQGDLRAAMAELGARPWQVELTAGLLAGALSD